jgi:hypothetical protein
MEVLEMSQDSQDFIFAISMLVAGFLICVLGAYSTFRQKLYYNPVDDSVMTEIDIPILGKLKTNVPALVLCFIGLIPMVFAAQYQTQGRDPATVKYHGKVAIDPSIAAGIQSLTVAAATAQWTGTPNAANHTMDVVLDVPEKGIIAYTFYAVAYGGSQPRLAVIGKDAGDDHTFELSIAP